MELKWQEIVKEQIAGVLKSMKVRTMNNTATNITLLDKISEDSFFCYLYIFCNRKKNDLGLRNLYIESVKNEKYNKRSIIANIGKNLIGDGPNLLNI